MKKFKVRKIMFHKLEVARLLAEHAANLDGEAVDEMQPVTILHNENTDEIAVEYQAFEAEQDGKLSDMAEALRIISKINELEIDNAVHDEQPTIVIFDSQEKAEEFAEERLGDMLFNRVEEDDFNDPKNHVKDESVDKIKFEKVNDLHKANESVFSFTEGFKKSRDRMLFDKANRSWLDNLMNDILKDKQDECKDCRFQSYCLKYTK